MSDLALAAGTRSPHGDAIAEHQHMFRTAGPDDFEAVARLYGQLKPDHQFQGVAETAFATIVASPWLDLFVLEHEGSVVATTYLNVIPNLTYSGSPYAVVENVVVDRDRRGIGIGQELMARTLDAAWDAGCYKVMLMTGSKDEATHAFYRRCGFSPDAKHAYLARRPA